MPTDFPRDTSPTGATCWLRVRTLYQNARTWDNFQDPEKPAVRESLLAEQGHICCYCGCELKPNDSHIEHFQPRSVFPQHELDYQNLLMSCQRDAPAKVQPQHCGRLKDDWFDEALLVSPLSIECEARFRFTSDGNIYPFEENDAGAKETIERLGLDIDDLVKSRAALIDTIFFNPLTDEEARKLIRSYYERNAQGRFQPFCFAVLQVLKVYYPQDLA